MLMLYLILKIIIQFYLATNGVEKVNMSLNLKMRNTE